MKRQAFTLAEFLVVVAVVAALIMILMPPGAFRGGTRRNAQRSSCQSNLKQIGLAFAHYFADYERNPPDRNATGSWSALLVPYLQSDKVFQCPSASGDGGSDYFYNARWAGTSKTMKPAPPRADSMVILSGDGADSQAVSALSQLPAAWRTDERSPAWRHLDGANYGFGDGHVKWFKAEKITLDAPSKKRPTFLIR